MAIVTAWDGHNPSRPRGGMVDTGDLKSPAKTQISNEISGFSAALANNLQTDADLQSIVAAWPALPAAVRAGIIALVKASGP